MKINKHLTTVVMITLMIALVFATWSNLRLVRIIYQRDDTINILKKVVKDLSVRVDEENFEYEID